MSGDDAKSTGWPPVRGPCYLRTMPSILPADVAAVHDGWRRRGHFVTLAEGQRLFVAQEGEGPDLLLVHGFPSTSHDFAAALPLLGAHFRVTAFDQLGFGFSDKPAGGSLRPRAPARVGRPRRRRGGGHARQRLLGRGRRRAWPGRQGRTPPPRARAARGALAAQPPGPRRVRRRGVRPPPPDRRARDR